MCSQGWQPTRMDTDLAEGDRIIEGVRIHWVELGSSAATCSKKPPVVLLHGLADSHLTWRSVAPLLATDRRVLMPDLPGCGYSTRADVSYTLDWQSQIIARWLEALALNTVDIVGHSFGGGVAQMLLLICPKRVRRIVLVASGGLGREVGFWLKFATFPFMVEHYGQPFMAFGTRRAIGGARLHGSAEDLETQAGMNRMPGTARAFSRTVRSVINFRGQHRLFWQRAGEVDVLPPIRVFWGDSDALIPKAHGEAFIAALEGVDLVTFVGAGHYLHQEQPKAFVAATRAFFDAPTLPRPRLRTTLPHNSQRRSHRLRKNVKSFMNLFQNRRKRPQREKRHDTAALG